MVGLCRNIRERGAQSPNDTSSWQTVETQDVGVVGAKSVGQKQNLSLRFYDIDRWYKARIHKPFILPTCYLIDPDNHTQSLEEKLQEMKQAEHDTELNAPVNIGLHYEETPVSKDEMEAHRQNRHQMEADARLRKLKVDVSEVENESSLYSGPDRAMKILHHFGLFKDLFHKDAYFYPVLPLDVSYAVEDGLVAPVRLGNHIKSIECSQQPSVSFQSESDKFWTLLMVNADGNPFEEGKEVLHWMVSNIPGNNIDRGDVLFDYLQPMPFYGTGFHRMVFILFLQEGSKVELNNYGVPLPCNILEKRTFSTAKFYKDNESVLTPAGLAFFQTDWDVSVRDCLHKRLGLENPLFEFEWPEPPLPPQEEYPEKAQPMHLYFDKYRSAADVQEEMLRARLARISPFSEPEPKPKYANIHLYRDKHSMSSWVHVEKRRRNMGVGKYRALYENKLQ